MKPAGQDLAIPNRAAFLREHKKRRLKRVFRIVLFVQDVTADPQHHRTVAHDQGLEGFLGLRVAPVQESLEQVAVRQRRRHSLRRRA